MILKKIISGGQTGADQAALVAAKRFGMETGGWMPKGFRTLEGPCPGLAEEFGMREHTQADYKWRTSQNVWNADAALRFAENWASPGEKCTLRAIKGHRRPYLDVNVPKGAPLSEAAQKASLERTRAWLIEHQVQTLNVAGNSEKTAPGIGIFVESYLTALFHLLDK